MIGIVPTKEANEIAERLDETFLIKISTTAKEQPVQLFTGIVSNISLKNESEYTEVTLELKTVTSKLDAKRNNNTFQQTSMTYGALFKKVLKGNASLTMLVPDKPIGSLIMQYNETDWEFIIRMASQLGSVVFVSIIAEKPHLYIGIPSQGEQKTIEAIAFDLQRSEQEFQNASNNSTGSGITMREDFSGEIITSYEYAYLGDQLAVNGKDFHAKKMSATLEDGLLECKYELGLKTSFIAPTVVNKQSTGRMMTGTVNEVKEDKVKVFMTSIDSSFDAGGDWWFPYSTAYSSQSGSGWYAMPEVGDEVRVFFPSDNEADAFAASSVCKNIRPNVKEKSFCGINGKQILLTEEGLQIICSQGKIYIDMKDKTGIEITSDMDINITAGTKINIQGGEDVKILAANEVLLGTSGAYIDMRESEIIMTAENVIIK